MKKWRRTICGCIQKGTGLAEDCRKSGVGRDNFEAVGAL